MKISLDANTDYYDKPEYNIESTSTLDKLKENSQIMNWIKLLIL